MPESVMDMSWFSGAVLLAVVFTTGLVIGVFATVIARNSRRRRSEDQFASSESSVVRHEAVESNNPYQPGMTSPRRRTNQPTTARLLFVLAVFVATAILFAMVLIRAWRSTV
jgi:hypothetical protein